MTANGHPARPAPYLQSARGQRRDAAARFRWGELSEKGRRRIRHAVPRLYRLAGMGDTSVAELLYCLGQAGILREWGEGNEEMVEEFRSNGGGNDGE